MILKVLSSLVLMMGVAHAYTFNPDVPEDIRQQTINDLNFMNTIQGSNTTPLHQQIFGAVGGDQYKSFFENRVKTVGLDDCGDANAVACVIPFYSTDTIWFTNNYIKFSHPQIARLMVVYHEARHTERSNGFWGHATCPTPFLDKNGKEVKSIWTGAPLAGKPGCDVTPFGSYGSSTILLKNISKYCTNCNEKVKMDAGIYADDQMGRIVSADAKAQMTKDLYGAE